MTKFYGIGVGPGDPELLTLKAVKALKSSDFIFEATSHTNTTSIAGSIVKNFIKEKAIFIPLVFPMLKNKKIMKSAWKKNAEIIAEKIFSGHICSFVTIGDPLLYSTCSYLISELKKIIPSDQIEIIPGISTIQICSAKTLTPLAEGDEAISIFPILSRKRISKIEDSKCKNIVIMKSYKNKNS
ncbi:MAG TPA: precorrin-2 C(20)-methyltransferase, partial [Victivallales bacterium]|nr:precorrin-2 C(20)-methyltransferase [Victivallales bacterium]